LVPLIAVVAFDGSKPHLLLSGPPFALADPEGGSAVYSKRLFILGILILIPAGVHADLITLDFSSGTFMDRPPTNGTDYYEQDGFIVELQDASLGIDSESCPGRWCAQNPYTAPQEVTVITRTDGSAFSLASVQVTTNSQGATFSADAGAYLRYDSVGTANFDAAFEGVTIVSIGVPCSGQYNSCSVTIDNIKVSLESTPTGATAWGTIKAFYR
jgi:hypothetical protein